jgi:hypothetical protein
VVAVAVDVGHCSRVVADGEVDLVMAVVVGYLMQIRVTIPFRDINSKSRFVAFKII